MKKIFLLLAALTFISLSAFADEVPFDQMHTTFNNGETSVKNVFNLNETPWLFLDLPSAPELAQRLTITNRWYYADDADFTFGMGLGTDSTSAEQWWFTPTDGSFLPNWAAITKAGNWHIDADYKWTDANDETIFRSGSGTYRFTVTPEPVSMALFGLGAGVLGLARRKRGLRK